MTVSDHFKKILCVRVSCHCAGVVIDNYLWETEDQGYVEIWLMLYSWSLLACSIFYIIFLLICSTWIPGIFFHSRCHFLHQRVFQICCLKDGQYQQLEVSNAFHRIHFPKKHILMFVLPFFWPFCGKKIQTIYGKNVVYMKSNTLQPLILMLNISSWSLCLPRG